MSQSCVADLASHFFHLLAYHKIDINNWHLTRYEKYLTLETHGPII